MVLTLRQEIEALEERKKELKRLVREQSDQINKQSTHINDLDARATKRETEINELRKRLKDQTSTHESGVAVLMIQIEDLRTKHQSSLAQLTQSQEEKKKLQEEVAQGRDEDKLPEAVDDGLVWCCSQCSFEVVDGRCQSCWTKHNWDEEMGKDTIPTQNEALIQDRQLAPRGTTPLREIGNPNIHRDYCGDDLDDRSEEYLELLRRGATRFMCETFHLEFNPATGIAAWADQSLYETFAGPAMQKGDFWKIHLGRCIELDDDDLDGSEFIEDLLEDALFFPLRSDLSKRTHERWETVQESPGIWVTRPMAPPPEGEADDDSDNGDDNDSDHDEHGDGSDADAEAIAKLETRDWVYHQSEVICADTYETDEDDDDEADMEDEMQDDVDVKMSDPGWSLNPHEVDATWPTVLQDEGDASTDVGSDDREDVKGKQCRAQSADHENNEEEDNEEYGNMAVSDFEDSDVAGSGFDEDEVLSGDEDIILDYY